jgi:predicted Fe-Mo cluster-binding NifX family protein
MGVTHLVAGNMGEGAVRVLQANGIAVTRGATGGTREAVERFAAGTLTDSGEPCAGHGQGNLGQGNLGQGSGHQHGHDCGHDG